MATLELAYGKFQSSQHAYDLIQDVVSRETMSVCEKEGQPQDDQIGAC
jgi:hypothetical protein